MSILGTFGLVGNVVTIVVLSTRNFATAESKNRNFNKILITMSSTDSLLIIYYIIEKAIVDTFSETPLWWYEVSFPYFLYPIRSMVETVTVFMVVAISAERFRAICYPLSHRHSAIRYIVFVIFLSVSLEFPRWFEFRIIQIGNNNTTISWTTELMEDPIYIRFSSYWDELISTGFVPLLALVFFNSRIYFKIKASGKFENRYAGSSASVKKSRWVTLLELD